MSTNSVENIALNDIAETLPKQLCDGNNDCWNVRRIHLATRETRQKNRALGLHKINKQKKD